MTVKVSAPLPPLTSTVSMPSPPSLRSVPSPGFQIMRSLPASPKTWSSPVAAGQDVVAVAAEQQVVAALAEQGVVAGLAEEQVVARAAGERCRCRRRRRGSPAARRRWPRRARWCRCRPGRRPGSASVLATVAVPPAMGTAPPLTRILPAASRLTRIAFWRRRRRRQHAGAGIEVGRNSHCHRPFGGLR